MTKVIVIGLDGATWDLLKPWADNGELPAIKKLMDNGVWGELESTIPPVTGPAWTSFSTGKNPGKHGIFDFVKLENNSLKLHQSRDIRSETIYDILSENNLKSIVIGLPLSFPPKDGFNGVMISDFLCAGKEIMPKSKAEYIEDYRVFPNIALRGDDLLEDMIAVASGQVNVAKQLFVGENWDFYFFYFFATDGVAHHFWKDIKENTIIGQKAKKVFHIADQFIGWVLNSMDSETILFLMSDHGFADYPFKINLNNLLAQKGLLRTKITDVSGDRIFEKHLVREFVRRESRIEARPKLRNKLAIYSSIKLLYKKIYASIIKETTINNAKFNTEIDFETSKCFVTSSQGQSIIINATDLAEYEQILNEIIQALRELKYDGHRVFKEVIARKGVYSGPSAESAPDILLIPNGFQISSDLGGKIFEEFDKGGWHDLRGIFLAFGPNIRTSSEKLTGLKIYDIAPTILHIFGLSIPRDIDGRVLKESMAEGNELFEREVMYRESGALAEKKYLQQKVKELRNQHKI